MIDIKEYREVCERIGKLNSDLEKLEARRIELEQQIQATRPAALSNASVAPMQTRNGSQPQQFDADSPPSLTHTKLLSAKLGGSPIAEIKWNALLDEVVRIAKKKAGNDQSELRRLLSVPFVMNRKEIEGYRFLSDVGLSVQGQDTNHAWSHILRTTRQLGVNVEVEFVWRSKNGAAHPGVVGRLSG